MDGKKDFLYQKVYSDLKEKIEHNIIKQGDRLKNEAELQDEYGVSRDTLRKALAKLEQDGFIMRKPALGTFVKRAKSDYSLFTMKSFSEQMREKGMEPSSELLSIQLTNKIQKEIADQLHLTRDERCYVISRIRKADGDPMSYEVAYIPYKICPDLQRYLHDKASLYEIYEQVYHLSLNYGKMTLEAEAPSAEVQELLGMAKGVPVLKMTCVFYLEDGRPLYYVESDYIGNRYFFSTEVPR